MNKTTSRLFDMVIKDMKFLGLAKEKLKVIELKPQKTRQNYKLNGFIASNQEVSL